MGEEERRGGTGFGIKRGGVEVVDYVCDGFDGAVPARSGVCQLGSIGRAYGAVEEWDTDILKLPPTKNWRAIFAIECLQVLFE